MKYIVHVKCKKIISPQHREDIKNGLQKSLGSDYLAIITDDNFEIDVYPKWIYNIKFVLKRSWDSVRKFKWNKLWTWVLIN